MAELRNPRQAKGASGSDITFLDGEELRFGDGPLFTWSYNSSESRLELKNTNTDEVVVAVDEADAVVDAFDDINFPNITGTPSFSGHTHSEGGLEAIPNAGLQNDSVTVSAGDGLKTGGSVSLGGSVTVDIEPADFAGTFISDDGTDNLTVDIGNALENDGSGNISVGSNEIQLDEIDVSIAPTWTSGHTFSAGISMSSTKIEDIAAPTNPKDAVTKQFAEGIEQGLDIKDSVFVVSESNIDLTSATDPNPIDGVNVPNGERVLLVAQTDATENGIYVANTSTDPTTWTRSADADEDSEVNTGLFTFIEEGTDAGGDSFVLTTSDPITVGVTNLTFTRFARAGTISGGDGIDRTGDTLDIVVSDFAGPFLSDDGAGDLEVDIGSGLEDDGTSTIRLNPADFAGDGLKELTATTLGIEPADFAGSGIQDDGSDNLELINDAITISSGDGLKNGGTVSLGNSVTIDIDVSDFAGSGLQDDGLENLELVNDSLTVSAGDGLKSGGSVSLGGSITIDIEPADFAGFGLQDDGADDMEIDQSISPTWTSSHTFSSGISMSNTAVVGVNSVRGSKGSNNQRIEFETGTGTDAYDFRGTDGGGSLDTKFRIPESNNSIQLLGNLNVNSQEVRNTAEVQFDNIEDVSNNQAIGYDASEGMIYKDSGGTTFPIWSAESVNAGTDITYSGGTGAASTPITINHANTSSQGNVNAAAGAAVTDVGLDGRGHVTSLGTTDFDSRFVAEFGDSMSGTLTINATHALDMSSGSFASFPQVTSQPGGATAGDFWYRSDLD